MERETHSRLPSQLSPSSLKSQTFQEPEVNVEPLALDASTEANLLDFYGMESLTAETWSDAQEEAATTRERSTMSSNPNLSSAITSALRDYGNPTKDPLGLISNLDISLDSSAVSRKKKPELIEGVENVLSLSSRDFDPKRFLAEYHKDTSFAGLKRGYQNLIEAVDQRNETMKLLVKSHFDRFVGAKSTVDAIYRELKQKNLESSAYGTDEFHKALDEASREAKELFHPIIERRIRADKIRSTASLLDRYKSFFNLPASLEESLKKGRYDQAVKDYKKGRSVLQAVKSQVLDRPASDTSAVVPAALASQKKLWEGVLKVFEKVWNRVENSVKELKSKLYTDLADMSLPLDTHESYLSYLIDLDIAENEDPARYYIDCRIKWIIKTIKASHETRSQLLSRIVHDFAKITKERDSNYRECLDNEDDERRNFLDRHYRNLRSMKLQKKLFVQTSKEFDAIFSNEIEVRFWRSILSMFTKTADVLSLYLPDFWILCKEYIDGKFKKSSNLSASQKTSKCIDLYSALIEDISKVFTEPFSFLQPKSQINPLINISGDAEFDEFLTDPKAWTNFYNFIKTQVVSACFYLPRIAILMSECNFCVSRHLKASIPSSVKVPQITDLQSLFDETQSCLLDFVSSECVKCSAELYEYEACVPISRLPRWQLEKKTLDRGTTSVRMLSHLEVLSIKTLFQIATLSASDSVGVFKNSLAPKTLNQLKSNFLQSIYVYLDGIRHVVFDEGVWESLKSTEEAVTDAKYLLSLENVNVILMLTSGSWFRYFQTMFECKFKSTETANFESICKDLQDSIFGAFVAKKNLRLNEMVSNACFKGGYNWKRNTMPSELHPHINEILYELVNLQSIIQKWLQSDSISDSGESLSGRLLRTILQGVFDTLRVTCAKIDLMSPHGGLHALVDIKAVLELANSHTESGGRLNVSSIEKCFRSIICENVSSYLACTKNKEESIKDIGQFLDSYSTEMEDLLIKWRFASELALNCLKQ